MFGVGQFFEFLILPAPTLQLQKLLIALALDLCLRSICLLGKRRQSNQTTKLSTYTHEGVKGLRITFGLEILLGKRSNGRFQLLRQV